MRTIAFSGRRPFERISTGIYKAIIDNHDATIRGIWVATDKREAGQVKAFLEGYDNVVIENYSDYITEHWDSYNMETLVEYEKKYDCAPMWKIIYADRYLINRDRDYCVKVACGFFDFWEHIFTTYEVEFYYDEALATLHSYVAYIVGKKTGTRYFSQMNIRGAGRETTHHYILDEPLQLNAYWDENYKEKEYSAERRAEAEEYLKTFEQGPVIPEFMRLYNMTKPKFQAKYLKLYPLYIRQRFFNPNTQNPASYMFYESWNTVLNPVKELRRYKRCRKYYSRADHNAKFVYFPLHFQPEASTIVCAQQYEKQQIIIDAIAKSLPADTLLYVKEHYAGLGSREESFYQDMQKYPNVVIIDPWENSRQLISECQCVLALTGTAGWEAVLMGKPVLDAGDCFYQDAPGVIHTYDVFGKYMEYIKNWKKPTRDELIQYLCEYLDSARPGCSMVDHEGTYEKDNLALLADSYMEYVEKITNETK